MDPLKLQRLVLAAGLVLMLLGCFSFLFIGKSAFYLFLLLGWVSIISSSFIARFLGKGKPAAETPPKDSVLKKIQVKAATAASKISESVPKQSKAKPKSEKATPVHFPLNKKMLFFIILIIAVVVAVVAMALVPFDSFSKGSASSNPSIAARVGVEAGYSSEPKYSPICEPELESKFKLKSVASMTQEELSYTPGAAHMETVKFTCTEDGGEYYGLLLTEFSSEDGAKEAFAEPPSPAGTPQFVYGDETKIFASKNIVFLMVVRTGDALLIFSNQDPSAAVLPKDNSCITDLADIYVECLGGQPKHYLDTEGGTTDEAGETKSESKIESGGAEEPEPEAVESDSEPESEGTSYNNVRACCYGSSASSTALVQNKLGNGCNDQYPNPASSFIKCSARNMPFTCSSDYDCCYKWCKSKGFAYIKQEGYKCYCEG
ncbi:MAG: hypothetical protein ABIG20_02875 [archaeon]